MCDVTGMVFASLKIALPNVPPGNYTVQVSYLGYRELARAVSVRDADNAPLDF